MDLCRSEILLGKDGVEKLKNSRVAVFGLGGVGSYAVEALARSGVGTLILVDGDVVSDSNVNRQLFALQSTVGMLKTEAAAKRVADINPDISVFTYAVRFDETTQNLFDFASYDYVIDAIDTVTSKLLLAVICRERNVPLISSMGAGNKLDATAFQVADISQTSVCPLAKIMRRELKKRGITHLKVVYSKEKPAVRFSETDDGIHPKRRTVGSVAFVPSVAGLIIAGEALKDLAGIPR